ncbi:MAG: DNA mismatch repair protein MutS [Methanobacteriota archaeon]|nr:MAG: DNA mismatch repair protein MutS [Euryarchaeota archaeon]
MFFRQRGSSYVGRATTPMMNQYFRIKEQHRDSLLLFRLGDFYEMFGEDAVIGSRELEITLTTRDKGKKEKIPLCGVPWHALDSYLTKLLNKGYKVAICEQLEDSKNAKGLVDRGVVRIVTPGTVIEGSALDSRSNNYLMALVERGGNFGMAFVDISTGEFIATEADGEDAENRVLTEFAQRQPKEVLVPRGFEHIALRSELDDANTRLTELEDYCFMLEGAEPLLKRHFKLQSVEGLGFSDSPGAISSAGAILRYLESTQMRDLEFLSKPKLYSLSDRLVLDQATLRNLEVVRNVRDATQENTLVSVLDYTLTPMGSRRLRKWLTEPSMQIEEIDGRLDAVQELVSNTSLRMHVGESLSGVKDLERLIVRVAHGSANARDLLSVKESIKAVEGLKPILSKASARKLEELSAELVDVSDVVKLIEKSISDDPPLTLKDGGLIRDGFDADLDELRKTSREGKKWLADLERSERHRTGIKNLKLGFNNVFGYYIEVSKANMSNVPSDYIRKQTLSTGERYVTPELKEKEESILAAQERMHTLEFDIFMRVRDEVAEHGESVHGIASAVSVLDSLRSFAEAAVLNGYSRPSLNGDDGIVLKDARHPVVERVLDGSFVPNDARLDTGEDRLVILTGPNMAGKSTYLRQIAHIVIMAQAGSFVPASEAKIGLVDRIFTRVGAFDDLSRGQSTFMVEMTELANILNCATKRSLILLDEVGRGTSTFDGLAIAWAVAEHLYDGEKIGAKSLFATHYHQLTELAESLKGVRNYSMAVKEQGSEIVFLRKVIPGRANKSYGIQVARLAGVPSEVVSRAGEVLSDIEERNAIEVKGGKKIHAQTRFSVGPGELDRAVARELMELDLARMTPMEAYVKLGELKRRSGELGGKDKGSRQ